jgi:biotin operon repressor
MRFKFPIFISLAVLSAIVPLRAADESDWRSVDAALGRKPALSADVHRYGFPRSDLNVTLDGVAIKPTLALGGWIAFKPMDGGAAAMGDLVLTESEINPVIARLRECGLEITAIHNHLLRASPPVLYVHVAGHGEPSKLAAAIRDALALSKTPLTASTPAAAAAPIDLDTAALDETLGAKGQPNGGVYQFAVPRKDQIVEHGVELSPPGAMGVATAINFQPTGGGKAAITGDFVLRSDEVNPVIRELQAHGIEVTAVHSHMLDEQPRLLFLHFWANDDALKLAKGLRAALDKTARAKS